MIGLFQGLVKRVFTGPKATVAIVRVGYNRADEIKVVLSLGEANLLTEGQHVLVRGVVRPGISTRKTQEGEETKSASLFVKPDFVGVIPDLSQNRDWGRNGLEKVKNLIGLDEILMARTSHPDAVTLSLYQVEVTATGMYRRLESDEWTIHFVAEEDGEVRFRPTDESAEFLKHVIPGDVLTVTGRPSASLRGKTAQVTISAARVEYA